MERGRGSKRRSAGSDRVPEQHGGARSSGQRERPLDPETAQPCDIKRERGGGAGLQGGSDQVIKHILDALVKRTHLIEDLGDRHSRQMTARAEKPDGWLHPARRLRTQQRELKAASRAVRCGGRCPAQPAAAPRARARDRKRSGPEWGRPYRGRRAAQASSVQQERNIEQVRLYGAQSGAQPRKSGSSGKARTREHFPAHQELVNEGYCTEYDIYTDD